MTSLLPDEEGFHGTTIASRLSALLCALWCVSAGQRGLTKGAQRPRHDLIRSVIVVRSPTQPSCPPIPAEKATHGCSFCRKFSWRNLSEFRSLNVFQPFKRLGPFEADSVGPMSKWESVLTSALDGSSCGIVLLDEDFEARFINRAYYGMWSLPAPPPGKTYNVTDLIAHARSTGAYDTSGEEMDDYVRGCLALICDGPQPPMHLRLSNGRILNFESQIQPAGGRMLTFDDITDLVQTADRLRVFATIDDLTKLLNRRQFLDSLKSEFSRSQRHSCLLSVSTRVELSGGELAVASLAVPSSSKRGFRRVDGKISEFLIERKSAMDSLLNVSQP